MIRITDAIALDEREIEESFIRASGPGGQNVNKLATAVQLRFDVRRSPSLPNDVAVRLIRLSGRRMTKDGVIVITAQRHRTQERNRQDALDRLVELIREAAVAPFRAVRPSPARLEAAAARTRRNAARASKACGSARRRTTDELAAGQPRNPANHRRVTRRLSDRDQDHETVSGTRNAPATTVRGSPMNGSQANRNDHSP